MAQHRLDIPQPDPIVRDQPGDCPHPPEFEPFDSAPTRPNHEESLPDGQQTKY